MGAYTSCTIFCDLERRRGKYNKNQDSAYRYDCSLEPTPESQAYCSKNICKLCSEKLGVEKVCDFPPPPVQNNTQNNTILRNSTDNAILHCPESGLSGPTFVSIMFVVAFILFFLMACCQYAVWRAYLKKRKIYQRIGALDEAVSVSQEVIPTHLAGSKPHVDTDDDKKNLDSTLQDSHEMGGEDNDKGATKTDSSSVSTTVEKEQIHYPELAPLKNASWNACLCEMAVLTGASSISIFLLYMFMQYKPEAERLATTPL